jgi:hypothetical protein
MWDTTGLTEPLDIHLVPAGAVDITVVIVDIALKVSNTGKYQWAPPATINIEEVEIIIVDATKKLVISETFIIIIIEASFPKVTHLKTISDRKQVTKTTSTTKKLTTTTHPLTSTVTKLATIATVTTTAKAITQLSTVSTLVKTVSLAKSLDGLHNTIAEHALTFFIRRPLLPRSIPPP